jgi:hypothetical protein
VAFIACCGITCTIPSFFSREAPPAACLPSKPPFLLPTTPLTCGPNLRTTLVPSGLLRDQSLATTTKTHRQLGVFPNSHTRHNPRNNPQRAQNGFGCPLRIPERARARPSLRCAPFKYYWCIGGFGVLLYIVFLGPRRWTLFSQRPPTSKYDLELEKRVLYAL